MKHRKIHKGFFSLLSLGEGQGVRLLLLVLFFCSCGDSNDAPSGTSAQIAENIQVSILPIEALSVPDVPATRAEKADTASLQVNYASASMTRADISKTTEEKEVKTAYVVQFNGTSPTSTAVWVSGDVAAQLNSANTIPCYFSLTSGVKSRVYVVANSKSVPTLGTTLQAFETVAYTVSTLPGTGLPMVASQDVALDGTFSTFQLKSPLARLKFTTNKGSLTLRGIPSSYSLVPATAGAAAVRPSGVTYTNTATLVSGTTYYVPTNMSGQVSLSSPVLRCSLFAPSNSMYVVISANSTTYNIYLGDSSDSDFNVVNNFAYTVGANVGGTDPVDMRVGTAPTITALDGNGTANCYIATSTNTWYSFNAKVMGNGVATTGITPTTLTPVSSDVLWETWNTKEIPTKGSVVKAAYMANGRILFRTSTNEGNAVIAARDASNNIVWSWHIWRKNTDPRTFTFRFPAYASTSGTFDDTGTTSRSGLTMMTCNLGALSDTNSNLSTGLHYQWGRKDPMPACVGFSTSNNIVMATQPTGIPAIAAGNNSKTLAEAVKNPTIFYTSNSGNYDWTSRNDNLWGTPLTSTVNVRGNEFNSNSGSKSIYDPCPVGWRVPPGYAYTDFVENITWDTSGNCYYFSSWFPASGERSSFDGELNNMMGYHWVSTPHRNSLTYGSCVTFGDGGGDPRYYCPRAFGLACRCVKE